MIGMLLLVEILIQVWQKVVAFGADSGTVALALSYW